MAAIADADISIDSSGNIRWTGAATTNRHTVLEFIQWLMDKQDDDQAAGDDLLDITVDTPFDRSTDQIVTLNSPFNIDDTFANHLYDGSVSQTEPTVGGETLYAGLKVIGPVEDGTEYMIVQDGKVLPAFWGTGINPEASPSLVFSRHLVKVKYAGCQIDGQKAMVLARELGDQYRRFPVTFGTGNSVAAIGNGADIFNETEDTTIAGWTAIVNTEGFQELDVDGTGTSGQEFYSKWDLGTETVLNRIYERTKWISQRSHVADATGGTPTGFDFIIDNATITGQAQSFIPLSGSEKLTEARFNIKIGAGTPTGPIHAELYDSDDAATGAPTGAVLARSEDVLASAITSTYEEVIFRFNMTDPSDGSDQVAGLTLANAEYFIALRHPDGGAADYFVVQGASTEQDATMNQADDDSGWAGSGTDDIDMTVKSSPVIHGVPGEVFQGINVEVGFDGETGTGVAEDNIVTWGTQVQYDTLVNGPFFPGEYVTIKDAGTLVSGAKVLYDDAATTTAQLILVLDTPGVSVIGDGDDISTVRSTTQATAKIDTTVVDEEKSGGSGILLAKDDNGADGELYLQVLTGDNPVDNNIIRRDDTSGDPLTDYCLATATINTRTVSPEFIGTSTGSNIIGSYGVGYDPNDVGSSDRFTDLAAAPRTPPNNVAFTVSGLVSGQDRVLVGPRSGSSLDRGQWLLSTGLSATNATTVVTKTGTETVPWTAALVNWPASSSTSEAALRIELDSGIYRRVDYTSHDDTSTFSIASTDFSSDNASADNDVFMAFIDCLADATSESFTGVHGGTDRNLFVRVRDGGGTPIKTFESTSAEFLSTPVTVAAVRTSDA